jgi:fructose-bisphosphate aldolase class 1
MGSNGDVPAEELIGHHTVAILVTVEVKLMHDDGVAPRQVQKSVPKLSTRQTDEVITNTRLSRMLSFQRVMLSILYWLS